MSHGSASSVSVSRASTAKSCCQSRTTQADEDLVQRAQRARNLPELCPDCLAVTSVPFTFVFWTFLVRSIPCVMRAMNDAPLELLQQGPA